MNLRVAGPLLAASAVTMAAYGAAPVRSVYACSAGPDWNPVEESEIIVSGVILGWEKADVAGFPEDAHVRPIRVELAVEESLKGEAPERLSFIDGGSLANLPESEGQMWWGSSGACGSFDADPTGMYVFMGLSHDDEGRWRSGRLTTFYVGERSEFAGFRQERTAEILGSFGLQRLPSAGDGTLAPTSQPDYERLALATFLIALGLGGLKLLRRTA